MGIIELLTKVGEKNVRVQNILDCVTNATMKKNGECVMTVHTHEVTVTDIALERGKVGMIVWIPRDLMPDLSAASHAGPKGAHPSA